MPSSSTMTTRQKSTLINGRYRNALKAFGASQRAIYRHMETRKGEIEAHHRKHEIQPGHNLIRNPDGKVTLFYGQSGVLWYIFQPQKYCYFLAGFRIRQHRGKAIAEVIKLGSEPNEN